MSEQNVLALMEQHIQLLLELKDLQLKQIQSLEIMARALASLDKKAK